MFSKSVYLAGSMIAQKRYGHVWRKQIQKWLEKNGFKVFNPCNEEMVVRKKYDLKDLPIHEWDKLPQPLQEEIIKKDLDQVGLKTRFVICYFTQYSTGTVSELSHALKHNVPVYFVTKLKLKGWPGTVSRADGNRRFKNFSDLKRFLKAKYRG